MHVAVLSYKRTAELWGRTSKTGIQKITCKPCASFLLLSFSDDFILHTPWSLFFFCGEFLLQSHAALHGEFLLVLHTLCWFMWEAPLACTCAGLYGEFLLHAWCWFIWGVSLIWPILRTSSMKYDTRGNKSVTYINGNLSISGLSNFYIV